MRILWIGLCVWILGHSTGMAQVHPAFHTHEFDDSHGNADHGRFFEFDYLQPFDSHGRGEQEEHGHAGHTSIEGYPFLHGIRTEIDFVERAFELGLARADGADGGSLDEWELEAEIVWAVNNRTVLILGAPFAWLDPLVGAQTAGLSDLEMGVQFQAFNGERSLLFLALNASVPTGDTDRDLGLGHAVLEPTALWLRDLGGGNYFQSRLGWEVPVSTMDVGSEFRYDVGLYHAFMATQDWCAFRFLTPAIELNGVTTLNGVDRGQTVLDTTVGIRWLARERDELGIGWSLPVSGTRNFNHQLLLSYRRHF